MSNAFQDPELMADAQSLIAFSNAVAQSAMHLYEYELNNGDKTTPEYASLRAYFLKNLPKLKAKIDKLEEDLG